MTPERTPELFDQWAEDYDDVIERWSGSFPFLGYNDVLNRIVELADPKPGMKILDVGTGTGTLAQKFLDYDCELWGLDYSQKMLEKAKEKLPNCNLVQLDIRDEWPTELSDFDRVVSAYALHHLNLDGKLEVIQRMLGNLITEDGRIVIGDVSYPTFAARAEARRELLHVWDDSEYYWAADVIKNMLWGQGAHIAYEQISSCAGIYIIIPS
jgi:putative AdoMet-dependent methyltransferase